MKSKSESSKKSTVKPKISYATIQIGPDTKLPNDVTFSQCIFIIVGGVTQAEVTSKIDYSFCKFFESPVGIEVEYWGKYYYDGKQKPEEKSKL